MKTNKAILTTTLIIGATATLLLAQEQRPPQQGTRPQGDRPQQSDRQSGGPGGQGQRPNFPLVDALDTNKNRVIDADEIANAATTLKTLDKNGDGKLTSDEFASRFGGQQGRPGGQGGTQSGPPAGQSSEGRRDRPKSE